MIKIEIRRHRGADGMCVLWAKLDDREPIPIKEGIYESLVIIPIKEIEDILIKEWEYKDTRENFLKSIINKYPKKIVEDRGGEVLVLNKSGNIFKSFKYPV